MNWEAIGAVGEILGAAAVFVSLIYLAVQIRGSTRQSQAAMVQAIASDFAQTHDPVLLNPRYTEILAKHQTGEPLTRAEELFLRSSYNRAFNVYLAVQHAYDQGQLSEDYFRTICKDVGRTAASYPGWSEGMREHLDAFPEEAKKELWRALYSDRDVT